MSIRKALAAVVAAALSLALMSCGSPEEKAKIYRSGSEVFLSGVIDTNAAARFAGHLNRNVRTVVLNSVGGDEVAALKIAALIHKKGLDVKVSGVCMSACAQYILIAGKTKRIERGSLVGCHHNVIAMTEISEREFGSALSDHDKAFERLARDFYEKTGTSQDFARVCMAAVVTLCACTYEGTPAVISVWEAWVPRSSDYEAFGIDSVVGAPTTEADAVSLLKRYGIRGTAREVDVRAERSAASGVRSCAVEGIPCAGADEL